MIKISARISEELSEQLRKLAFDTSTSQNKLIIKALTKFIASKTKKITNQG